MKILVTGASGFIGSFLVEEGIGLGHSVWAGIRRSSSRRYLTDGRINPIVLSLENPDELREQLSQFAQEHGRWDYVIHAAGATKCVDTRDFMRVNFDGQRTLSTRCSSWICAPGSSYT